MSHANLHSSTSHDISGLIPPVHQKSIVSLKTVDHPTHSVKNHATENSVNVDFNSIVNQEDAPHFTQGLENSKPWYG
jgi:predicted protein tyrosine phosphatase